MPPGSFSKSFLKTFVQNAVVLLTAFGCAASYKPVTVSGLTYHGQPKSLSDTIRISYEYNVQETSHNKYYAAKEIKHGLAAIAVHIENISNAPVIITRENFKIYSRANEKRILSPIEYSKKVKQSRGLYMLHALWGPYLGGYYIPFGFALGIHNVVRAANANRACRKTMEIYEVWNKKIEPGKALDGIITLQAYGEEPLSFSYGKSNHAPADSVSVPDQNLQGELKVKSEVHNFFVVPTNGTSYNVTAKINTDGPVNYILAGDPSKAPSPVYPGDTKSLSRMTEDGKQLLGIPHGNYWLFKTLSGNINAYHILSEQDITEITHIQKGSGAIVKLTPYSIIQMAGSDPEVLRLIGRGKYYDAIVLFNSRNK